MISQELLETTYSFEFEFTDLPGTWLSTTIEIQESLNAIKTGLLKNRSISKIKLFSILSDETSIYFIYDVTAAKSGNQPWSLMAT